MAIRNAFERDGFVVIVDETGNQCGSIQIGGEPKDGLAGYTATTVSVREGIFMKSYDERGQITGSQQIEDWGTPRGGSGCLTALALVFLSIGSRGGWILGSSA